MCFSWWESNWKREVNRYLSLTQFEGHTGSYELHFFTSIYGASAKHPGRELKRKKQGAVTYSIKGTRKVG